MDKKEMFGKVGEILKELNEQYQYLSKAPDKMNELEIELFVANANFLADHIKIVQKLNGASAIAPVEQTVQKNEPPAGKTPFPPDEEPSVSIENKTKQEDKQHDAKVAVEDPEPKDEPDLKFEFEESTQDAEGKENKMEEETKAATAVSASPVVHEVVIREKTISLDTSVKASNEPAPTLNDVIAAQLDQTTVASKYNKQSVADLKSIISLNDKLLFVKDLFNGYSLAYSEAIELLNRFDSLDSADNFLKTNYSAKNNWSDKQSTVDKFYEILNRRFTK